jgi:hypothetical protein
MAGVLQVHRKNNYSQAYEELSAQDWINGNCQEREIPFLSILPELKAG